MPENDVYTLTFRYANGNSTTKACDIVVNGQTVKRLSFPSTVEATNWSTVTHDVALEGGANTIRVRYESTDNQSIEIDRMNLRLSILPTVPGGLQAEVLAADQVNLTWIDNSDDETGFVIERKTGNGFNAFVEIATVGAGVTNYSDAQAASSEIYYYRVKAYNSFGDSDYTQPTLAITGDEYQAEAYTKRSGAAVLSSPAGYTGTGYVQFKYNYHNFEWNNVNLANQATYTLRFRYFNNGSATRKCDILLDGQVVQQLDFPPAGAVWRAKSLDVLLNAGNNRITVRYRSPNGTLLCIDKMDVTPGIPPAAPNNLDATFTDTQVSLDWEDNADNEVAFVIERKTSPNDLFVAYDTVAANSVTYQDNGLTPSSRYFYRARAYNGFGGSAYTNTVSLITKSDGVNYQAETYTSKNQGAITSKKDGYTGFAYFQFKYSGHWFEWDNVEAASTGTYTLSFRYLNEDPEAKMADIIYNDGADTVSLSFPTTGDSVNWSTVSVDVPLEAGENTLRVVYTTATNDVLEIDKMVIEGLAGSNARVASGKLKAPVSTEEDVILTLYPNPATKNVRLSMSGLAEQTVRIDVHNNLGQVVFTTHKVLESSVSQITLPLGNIRAGSYLVGIRTHSQQKFHRLIIRR